MNSSSLKKHVQPVFKKTTKTNYDNSPSENNRRFIHSYPQISDEKALAIANGKSVEGGRVIDINSLLEENNELGLHNKQATGAVFVAHETCKPVLHAPTKKEALGSEYRGSRMFRKGSRNKHNS